MARLRLAGMVVEVRAEDLAFRTDEAAELFEHLYRKLRASNRREAVARARALDLL